ncbi:hypothetical protein [Methylobacterium dankookense]|uniref:Uncharacterized protein n=1 Tax=Methylobacterium dankookense TaxID=560405 RepID=A0A564FUP8_9HYPH|nr:hypothetical protein [Methylobacterium dankookense]GJD56198.1 hypothetical protein IFDJLNFL_2093 [Methylobacterium dankookense]VUF11772.1 hypothetical protein MTDSW087_01456 [Methylobacterium dankookense]
MSAAAASAAEGGAAGSLCQGDEDVLFSCALGGRVASLCATLKQETIERITYRYGTRARIEISYAAESGNGNRFKGTVAPASPRALIRQVWFDRGPFRYLLTECLGGDCVRPAGLAVLRGDRVVKNGGCTGPGNDRAWFSDKLVDFKSAVADSRSKTELLVIEDADNMPEKLY